MTTGIAVLATLLFVPTGPGSYESAPVVGVETDPGYSDVALRELEEEEDDRPLYYGSEVLVVSDRPARFEAFSPRGSVRDGQAAEELAWSPHVHVSDYGTSTYPGVRGLPSEHVAFEYDGVPLNSLQNGLFDVALFDVFDTRATLMRGPFARLGTGRPAQAAVSLKGAPAPATGVTLTQGSTESAARFSLRRGDFGVRVGLLKDEGYEEKTSVGGFGVELTGAGDVGEGALTFIKMERGIPGPDYQQEFAGDQWDEFVLARVGLKEIGRYRPGAYVLRHEQEYKDSYFTPIHITTCGGMIVGIDLNDVYEGTLATVSFDYSQLDSHDPDTLNPDLGRHRRGSGSAVVSYAEDHGPLRLAAEAAVTVTDDFGAAPSGAYGISLVGGPGRAWLSIGMSYRPPTMNELYWPEDSWSGGNADLEPERVLTAEIGAASSRGPFSGVLSAYSSHADDLINWQQDPEDERWRPVNVGRAHLMGVELELSAEGSQGALSYALNLSRARDTGEDLALQYRPSYSHWFSARFDIARVRNEVRIRHIGEAYADAYEGEKVDGYTVVDLSTVLDLPLGGVSLGFEVTNLLCERYETRKGYEMPDRQWCAMLTMEQ